MKNKSDVKILRGIPVEIRFWRYVDKTHGEKSCWNWKGSTAVGYGQFWDGNKLVRSHRFAWEQTNGEIPIGFVVCHSCDNRKCCNPDHLFIGTQKDNIQDAIKKGRI
jgi:hypothetical protein